MKNTIYIFVGCFCTIFMLYYGICTLLNYNNLFNTDNQYFGVILVSFTTSLVISTLTTTLNTLTFIFKCAFMNWITINNTDKDGYGVYDWLVSYLETKMNKGELYSITTSVETANSRTKSWFNPDKNSDQTQIRFVPGKSSWSMMWDGGIILVESTCRKTHISDWGSTGITPKYITLYSLFPGVSKKKYWDNFITKIRNIYTEGI